MKSIVAAAAFMLICAPISADAGLLQFSAQPMHTEGAPCAETSVSKVSYYFENDPSSGIYVAFSTTLGVSHFPNATAAVVDRQKYVTRLEYPTPGQPGVGTWGTAPGLAEGGPNPVMLQERAGDHVQVCLVSVPTPEDCDPSKDRRGRIYRVFDYRLRASYTGPNSNHFCGGA